MNKSSIWICLILNILFFQNMTSFKGLAPKNLKEVTEKTRLEHAKELLGKYYRHSPVAETVGLKHINIHLFNQVEAHLPKEDKKYAGKITKAVLSESKKFDIDPVFVIAMIRTESNFDSRAVGSVGELGLMQIRPETGRWIANKEKIKWNGAETLKDPVQNIKIGIAYMAFLRDYFDNKAYKYLSAYNVGPGKLKKLFEAETRPKKYSITVMKYYQEFYSQMAVYANLQNLATNRSANAQIF